MKWISFEQLADEMVTKPQIFAPWFIIAAPQVMKMV
jgi:isopentenyldiphosphate isomerase